MSEKISHNNDRETFSSKFGFIISCIGAALGLGNIWMFSYRLGTYGGAAFLIPYFLFVFFLGTTGLITEFTFGRTFRAGSITGIKKVFKSRNLKGASLVSSIPVIGLTGILMFYSIVIGWILKYFALSVTGEIQSIDTTTYFDSFAGTTASIPWFLLAMLITLLIVCLGVSKGIEKLNKIIMPLLLLLFILLTIRSISLPGAMAGVEYLLKPRWGVLLNMETWIMALGQAFFTVSLTGCGMVVYGSYTNDEFDIISSSFSTALFDTIAALLAAFMIMPAVFAFGLDPAAGPSLLFITVPSIFKSMAYGNILSILFFLSIILAAISSSVSMLEGPVEAIISISNLSRKKASVLVAVVCFILALPLTTDIDKFNSFANFITIIVSPTGAMIVAIVSFFLFKGDILEEVNKGAKRPLGNWFIVFGRWVFVPVTVIVIILGVIYGGIG
ncbi:sodium-dependent transporter [Romboutsia sp.]|uniref:sodium-dependent transporter n=1 Tax=Romboutsia sp. TaxID=1965302 RepID=UPI002BD97337|nr:sodium-dependent transporter [Romboutsia sp.]HSQ90070.1 sodium-dependent transporter [Romboutsia sp.]